MKNIHKKSLIKFIYKNYQSYSIFLIIFIACLLGFYQAINAFLLKNLIDSLNTTNTLYSLKYLFYIMLCYSINHILWRLQAFIELKTSNNLRNNIINLCFEKIQNQSYNFFQNNLSGALSSSIITLCDSIGLLVYKYLTIFIRSFFQTLLTIILISIINPIFGLIIFSWALFFLIFSIISLKKYRSYAFDLQNTNNKISGFIVDTISNFYNIKIFASYFFEKKELNILLSDSNEKFKKKNLILLIINSIQAISIILSLFFVLYFIIQLKIKNLITIGDCVLIITLLMHVFENLWFIAEFTGTVSELIEKCRNSLNLIFVDNEMLDSKNARDIKIQKGDIEFVDVFFKYKSQNQYFFSNLSLKIDSGKKIGLVGSSGSGKSSFVNLILRLYDIESGQIKIDDHNITDYKQDSLRSQITVIPQDPSLFNRSFYKNLEYGLLYYDGDLDESQKLDLIQNAAFMSYSKNFIENCIGCYDHIVGEKGSKLSGGQKQRIAIARAFLKNSKIIIMDEATSALDSIIEKKLQKNFLKFTEGKTLIVIAHRLSTLISMDEIIVFEKGKVVERGSHSELILIDSGYYKKILGNTIKN